MRRDRRVTMREYDAQSWFQLSSAALHLGEEDVAKMAYMRAWQFGEWEGWMGVPIFILCPFAYVCEDGNIYVQRVLLILLYIPHLTLSLTAYRAQEGRVRRSTAENVITFGFRNF